MRSALIWESVQRMVVKPYRRFGVTSQYHFKGSRNPERYHEKAGKINKFEHELHSILLGLLLLHTVAITRHSNC